MIRQPSTGIYYFLRYPNSWKLATLRFDNSPEIDHAAWWENDLTVSLTGVWEKPLRRGRRELETVLFECCYAFPRGRVSQTGRRFLVNHGNDLESFMGTSKAEIEEAFGIADRCSWRFDEHEQCLSRDRDLIRRALQIPETWKALTSISFHRPQQ